MQNGQPLIAAFLVALAAAAAVTPLVRAFARRIGSVAVPKSDRWHRKPTAMLGGVAIFIAVIGTVFAFVPLTAEKWAVIAGSSFLFLIGLVDDFIHLKPYQKLAAQICAAAGIVYVGLVLPWTGSFTLNMIITFVWLVGVTNAVNMLDNMDGLAAGVAAIAGLTLAVTFVLNGRPGQAMMLAAFAGALIGFLIYNHNPASVFMGDCGSMFIGFFLASATLLASQAGGGRSRSVIGALAVPVLVLCIPIFDTTFVTLMRKLAGRPASQGGRDHTSHRLVALGLTERHAVWMMYVLAALGGTIAIGVRRMEIDVSVALILGFALVLALTGVYLARVRVYSEKDLETATQRPLVAFLIDLSYKRRIFELSLDVFLIVFAYYLAYASLFGPLNQRQPDWQLFMRTLPAVVAIKLLAFLVTGIYRGIWRYAGMDDVISYIRAVAAGSIGTILLVLFAFSFEGFSRIVFLLDGLFLLFLVTASRFAFRLLRRAIPVPHSRTGKRVLIFGAGDAGELVCRELNNNEVLQYVAVGFVDDDERKTGKMLHGLKVYSGDQSLETLCRELDAETLLLSTRKVPLPRLRQIFRECESASIPVERMSIELRPVAEEDLVPGGSARLAKAAPRSDADTLPPHILTMEK
ncbi:MAG TPA: hypothetical protein VF701_22315 [Thermoanaerobaculia bacterium]